MERVASPAAHTEAKKEDPMLSGILHACSCFIPNSGAIHKIIMKSRGYTLLNHVQNTSRKSKTWTPTWFPEQIKDSLQGPEYAFPACHQFGILSGTNSMLHWMRPNSMESDMSWPSENGDKKVKVVYGCGNRSRQSPPAP